MKSRALQMGVVVAVVAAAGCTDILTVDNYAKPEALLTGRVVHQGQPVGVRNGGVQLELWEPGWELDQKIVVHVNQDGTFSSRIFDGDYEINLLPGNGPWVDDPARVPVTVRGGAALDLEVEPYYTVVNEQVSHAAGSIEATFSVGEVNTSRDVELVGVYVGTTQFVDRINQVVSLERPRSEIASLSEPLGISVALPTDIHVTAGPEVRSHVYVRIGVKTLGVAEMLFSPVHKVAI